MTMRLRLLPSLLAFLSAAVAATAAPSESLRAAQLLVLGQDPVSSDQEIALGRALEAAESQLRQDPAQRAATAEKAKADAFGGAAVDAPASSSLTYAAQVTDHLAWLAEHPEAYAQVLQQAYRFVINRDVYEEEVAYWTEQPARLSYIMLVACIEDWARRNQPGLMVTAGQPTVSINCEFLATARLSPADAAVAREYLGLGEITAPGHHVIAPGAAHLKSGGGIHFVAAGSVE